MSTRRITKRFGLWICIAKASDKYEVPRCRGCGTEKLTVVITGVPRLPGDPLPDENEPEV